MLSVHAVGALSASAGCAVTVTVLPGAGRDPGMTSADAMYGACDPHAPTVTVRVAGALEIPLLAVATSETVYVPGAPATNCVVAPEVWSSEPPAGETLHAYP